MKFIIAMLLHASVQAGIVPISSEQDFASQDKLVNFRGRLPENRRGTFEVLDASLFAASDALLGAFEKRLEPMLLDAEKQGRVFIMISRTLQANAHFVDLGGGDRLVVVSMGLLSIMPDDDKTVAIMGHELEHGWSQIQDVIDAKKSWISAALQRVVENEVDVKSVFKRVMRVGGNPYAMKSALRILRERYGDGVSHTHTTFGSREDSLDIAVTVARRELGMEHITLDDQPRLKGGMTDLLKTSNVTEYERRLVADLQTRLGRWTEDAVNFNLSQLKAAAEGSYSKILTQSQVFEQIWSRMLVYFDTSMQQDHYNDLRSTLLASIVRVYSRILIQEIEQGQRLDRRSLDEIRKLLRMSEVLNRDLEVEFAKHDLDRLEKMHQEAVDEYRPDPENPDDEADRMEIDKLAREREAKRKAYQSALRNKEIFDAANAPLKSIRRKILNSTIIRFKRLSDWHYLRDLRWPEDKALVEYVVAKMTTIRDLRILSGDPTLFDFWRFLEETDLQLLEMAFVNTCRSAILNQSYYGFIKNISRYIYPLDAIQALTSESHKRHLITIAKKVLVEPLQKMAQAHLLRTFVPTRHPDPRENTNREAAKDETAFDRLQVFLSTLDAIHKTEEDFKSAGLNFRVDEIITADIKASFDDKLAQAYLELDPRIRQILSQQMFRRVTVLDRQLEDELKEKSFDISELQTFLQLRRQMLSFFPDLNQVGSWKKLPNESRTFNAIWSILDERGYFDFFQFIGNYGEEKARHDPQPFFELVEAVSKVRQLSFHRQIVYLHPQVDADGAIQAAYARWLVEHREDISTDDHVFTQYQKSSMDSYPADLTEDQRALREANKKALESIDFSGLHAAKLQVALRTVRRILAEKPGLSAKEKIKVLRESIDLEVILQNPETTIASTGVELAEGFYLTIRGTRAIDQSDYRHSFKFLRRQLEVDSEHRLLYYQIFFELCSRAEYLSVDDHFEYLWAMAGSFPDSDVLRKVIAERSIVSLLRLRRHKIAIFNFRMRSDISPQNVEVSPNITTIRDAVTQTVALVTFLFPKPSDVRDTCIDIAGRELLTNPAETDLLYGLTTNTDNFQNNEAIALLDLPSIAAAFFSSNKEKMAWLRYFTGQIDQDRLLVILGPRVDVSPNEMQIMTKQALRNFQDADVLLRGFILLPLLDDFKGLLADEGSAQEVKELVLGPYLHHVVANATYDAYFRALPSGERRVVLAGILAGFIDREQGQKGFITNIVNGLKAMGIKSAQLYRATGLAPKELHEELDSVFDAAMPVRRDRALKTLRRSFGASLEGMIYFGESLGFGSINHVWHLKFVDASGQVVDTATRVLRDNVTGQVRNENEVWLRVLEDLKQHNSPEVQYFAHQMDQVRMAIVPHLLPGGSEVDFIKDREIHQRAQASYTGKGARSGRNIHLVPLLPEIQSRVDASMQSSVSVMQLIRQKRLSEHPQRDKLGEDALGTELHAIFRRGEFDADGHVGNWLPSQISNDLYRTDWSQFVILSQEEKNAVVDIFKVMLMPQMTQWSRKILRDRIDVLFDLNQDSDRQIVIEHILQMKLLAGDNPVERVYRLRSDVENALQVTIDSGRFLNLHPKMMMVIHALAKSRMHVESIGERRYNQIFAQELGLNLVDKGRIVGSKVKQSLVQLCQRVWRK